MENIQKAAWDLASKKRHRNNKTVSPGVLRELRKELSKHIVETDVDDFLILLWYLNNILELTQGQATATLELSREADFKEAMKAFLHKVQGPAPKMRVRRPTKRKPARPPAAPRKSPSSNRELAQMRGEKSELQKSIAALKRRHQELAAQTKTLAAQERELQRIKAEQQKLLEQRTRVKKQFERLRQQNEKLESEAQKSRDTVQNHRQLKKSLALDIQRLQEKRDNAQQQLDNVQYRLQAWEDEKKRREDLATELEIKIMEMEEQVQDLKARREERTAAVAETERLRREAQELQGKLDTLRERLTSKDELIAEIARLDGQKDQLTEDLLAMSKRLSKQERAYNDLVRNYEAEERKLKVTQREHARLQEETSAMAARVADCENLRKREEELRARVENLHQAVEVAEKRLEHATSQSSLPLWLALLHADLRAGEITPLTYREGEKTYTLWGDEVLKRAAALVPNEIAPRGYATLAWEYAARGADGFDVTLLQEMFPIDELPGAARLAAGVALAQEYDIHGEINRAAEELTAGWEAWLEDRTQRDTDEH